LDDILARGFSPLDFRYLCLQAHYRSKLNFTWEALEAARNSRLRLLSISQDIRHKIQLPDKIQISNSKFLKQFADKILDDLNTPEALAVLWEMLRDEKITDSDKLFALNKIDKEFLAIGIYDAKEEEIPSDVL